MSSETGSMKKAVQTVVAGVGSSVIVGGGIAASGATLFASQPAFAPIATLTGLVILGLGSLFSFIAGVSQLTE